MGKIAEDYPVSAVRDDRVPKDVYFSEDFGLGPGRSCAGSRRFRKLAIM